MSALSRVKRAGWKLVRPLALQALSHTGTFDVTWRSLRRLRQLGLTVHMAVDGGAARGEWTAGLKKIYPAAQVLCVEPRHDVQADLKRVVAKLPGVQIAQSVLGDREGEIEFHVHSDQSSVLKNASGFEFGESRRLPLTTLDACVNARGLPKPDLIKLDLQGSELLALRGAKDCLAHAQAVVLEVSLLPLYEDAPLLADLIGFMAEAGFRTYDIVSLWHRPLDKALAFGDFVFVPDTSPLVADGRWSTRAPWERTR
jgi:FkbM family methyltransferase